MTALANGGGAPGATRRVAGAAGRDGPAPHDAPVVAGPPAATATVPVAAPAAVAGSATVTTSASASVTVSTSTTLVARPAAAGPGHGPVAPPPWWWTVAVAVLNGAASATALALALALGGHGADPDGAGALLAGAAVVGALPHLVTRSPGRHRPVTAADEAVLGLAEAVLAGVVVLLADFLLDADGAITLSRSTLTVYIAAFAALGTMVRLVERIARSARLARGRDVFNLAVITGRPLPEAGAVVWTWPGCAVVAELAAARPVEDLRDELARLAVERGLAGVVLATDELAPGDLGQLLTAAELRTVELWAVPDIPGVPAAPVRLDPTGTGVTVVSPVFRPLVGWRARAKRLTDVVVASATIAVLSPVMLAAAVAVRLSSPGPVLFRQVRVGIGGRGFQVLKFRTMTHGAPTAAHEAFVAAQLRRTADTPQDGYHKMARDPRITRVGAVLRRFSIDELPQLFNVVRGDMSLVGPRPALPYETRLYEPWQWRRLDVRPGMTGLWQVSGRSRLSMPEMIRLDIEYVERCSLGLDLGILARTPVAVLRPDAT